MSDWDRVHDVNLKASFLCARGIEADDEAEPRQDRQHNVDLQQSESAPLPGEPLIALPRPRALSLTAAMAAEVKQYNININAILPARTNTAMFRKYHRNYRHVKGLMEPEDIAKVALFLCSEDARAIKGVPIEVSNGQDLPEWDGTEESR